MRLRGAIRISRQLSGLVLAACACANAERLPTDVETPADTAPPIRIVPRDTVWDLDTRGLPRLIMADYIDLSRIASISRFRSSVGHDYSDAAERCRSMKHYFMPADPNQSASIVIRSPVRGRLVRTFPEWAGTQLHIEPDSFPAFTIVLFHVQPDSGLAVGDAFERGERIGTHVGPQTYSDVAIRVMTPGGFRLVSYIHALSDSVWTHYAARGLTSRDQAVISRSERDADPLTCNGETFMTRGTLTDWIPLR